MYSLRGHEREVSTFSPNANGVGGRTVDRTHAVGVAAKRFTNRLSGAQRRESRVGCPPEINRRAADADVARAAASVEPARIR